MKNKKEILAAELYDYSTVESREKTAQYLFEYAKTEKQSYADKFAEYDSYYKGEHKAQNELATAFANAGFSFVPPVVPDPYIHVESQIDPELPDFEFCGRDSDYDSDKARQREFAVRYILENNRIKDVIAKNERRLNKYGNAFWKAYWDSGLAGGDIALKDIDPANIFPDPSACDLDSCEYIDYAYMMHKNKAARVFGKELAGKKLRLADLSSGGYFDTEIYRSDLHNPGDDNIQIVEHWFRQPCDGEATVETVKNGKTYKEKIKYSAGDIACIVMAAGHELKYIPKYWIKTAAQNKRYPFVHYYKIASENQFWAFSEMEVVIPLADAADREIAFGQLNNALTSNDIFIMEENSLAEGQEITNEPGGVIVTKPGKLNSVRRMGGLSSTLRYLANANVFQEQIEKGLGNFDSANGVEPARVTTASGIAQLNERAEARKNIKKADRLNGFERLFELLDWLALEFFEDEKLIFIGAADKKALLQYEMNMIANPGMFISNLDPKLGPIVYKYRPAEYLAEQNGEFYYPRIDATVRAGDGARKSKSYSVSLLETMSRTAITEDNYKFIIALLEVSDIPQSKELASYLEEKYGRLEEENEI